MAILGGFLGRRLVTKIGAGLPWHMTEIRIGIVCPIDPLGLRLIVALNTVKLLLVALRLGDAGDDHPEGE